MRLAEPSLAAKGSGSTFQAVGRKEIASLMIALPLPEEQRRIVGLLDRAAEIRRRAEAARAKARAVIPALFLDTFGDPATNPKGWPVTALGNVADVQGGLQVSAAREVLPEELPYLRVANVLRGVLDLSEIKLIRMTKSERQRTLLRTGDVLIVEGHGNPKEIGRAAVWGGSIDPCTHHNQYAKRQGSLTSAAASPDPNRLRRARPSH
jgi:type I restriction enzyme S subunit